MRFGLWSLCSSLSDPRVLPYASNCPEYRALVDIVNIDLYQALRAFTILSISSHCCRAHCPLFASIVSNDNWSYRRHWSGRRMRWLSAVWCVY